MQIVTVPSRLDSASLDQLLGDLAQFPDERILFDARSLRWVDPAGILGLLAAGSMVRDRQGVLPRLQMVEGAEVTGYLARMGFLQAAQGVFDMDVRPPRRVWQSSEVLLAITPIHTNTDVHGVVDQVQEQAGLILTRRLGYPATAVIPFSVVLSEVCQNIVEHAGAPGWVAAQVYHWAKRLGRDVLVLSVADIGQGFRGSLAGTHSPRFGSRWGDAAALEAAFIHGLTRFPDSGRGQGIQQIRKQVRKWDGAVSIRSGTARIADVPPWDDTPPLEDNLPPLPGAQILLLLPARVANHV